MYTHCYTTSWKLLSTSNCLAQHGIPSMAVLELWRRTCLKGLWHLTPAQVGAATPASGNSQESMLSCLPPKSSGWSAGCLQLERSPYLAARAFIIFRAKPITCTSAWLPSTMGLAQASPLSSPLTKWCTSRTLQVAVAACPAWWVSLR